MSLHAGGERGITYLFLMFAIVLIGIVTTMGAQQWKMMMQRELEADLLTKGIEIQNALALYSTAMKAGRVIQGEVYPQSLMDLTRLPKPYLRKVYLDPLTRGTWDYIRSPSGGIMGVRTRRKGEPMKKHEFPLAVRHFDGMKSYRDWIFQHPNPSTVSLFPSTAPPGPGGSPQQSAPSPGVPEPFTTPSDDTAPEDSTFSPILPATQ
ncbi:conserved exported protein of unknown function [Nitrospira sp. KM1]|nr:conserved exported protein of unknown function [Nitrospira sp. KM1]